MTAKPDAKTDGLPGAQAPSVAPGARGVEVGEIIAEKFRVDRVLGEGGMGVVVLATHLALEEKFALKVLRSELARDHEVVERFSREAKACVKIKSEHVARVHDVGMREDGTPFMVMEYLVGTDLGTALQDGPLPIEEAVEYVIQACEALAQAHANGIVHRDIKPENLFLVSHAEGGWRSIKLLDFGISKAIMGEGALLLEAEAVLAGDDAAGRGDPTRMMGTPLYMSPEQLQRRAVDGRSDVWSLGVVLYELLTARSAWIGDSVRGVATAILESPPPSLESVRHDAPYGLSEVIHRCLEKDPDKRFPNVAELAIALLPFAPRRARVSAERSTQVIRAAGLSSPDLKFPTSVYPPSFSALAVSPSASSLQPPSLPAVSRDAPTVMDVEAALDDAPAPRRRAWVAWLAAAAVVAVASVVWTRTRAAVASDGPVAVEAALPAEPDSPRETASAAFDRGAPAEEELEILPPQAPPPEAKSVGTPRLAVATSTATAAATALAMTSTATPRRPDARTRLDADAGSAIDVASAEDPDLGY